MLALTAAAGMPPSRSMWSTNAAVAFRWPPNARGRAVGEGGLELGAEVGHRRRTAAE